MVSLTVKNLIGNYLMPRGNFLIYVYIMKGYNVYNLIVFRSFSEL